MSEQKPLYTLIFDGKIQESADARQVRIRLANLFQTDEKKIQRLFQHPGTAIKQGLTQEHIIRYKLAIEKTGALCRIVKEAPQTGVDPLPNTPQTRPPAARPDTSSSPSLKKKTQTCPKCKLQQDAERDDCLRCGIVFSRFASHSEDDAAEQPLRRNARRQRRTDKETDYEQIYGDEIGEEGEYVGPLPIEREGWLSLAGGAVITAIVLSLPFLNYILSYLIVLVHELGHTVSHWLFGYPSVPAFDFTYGGGVAIYQSRQSILLVCIYLCFAYLCYLFRHNPATLVICAVSITGYSFAAFTSTHEVISLFMGHGSELVFATIFLYRAISGSAVIVAVERPLYAFLGLFIEFRDIRFAYRLMTSRAYRIEYEAAKGGGHWMDFSRIAEEYLRVDVTVVAGFFLMCCLLPPLVAFLAYRYRTVWLSTLSHLLTPEPE